MRSCSAVCFSSDDKHIIIGTYDGVLKLYSAIDLRLVKTIPCHSQTVSHIEALNDSQVVTSSEDRTAR